MGNKNTSKQQVISELMSVFNIYKKITEPLIDQICSFSRRAVRTHFGSITNFLKEMNIENEVTKMCSATKGKKANRWTKEQVIKIILKLQDDNGFFSKTILEKSKLVNHKVINRIWGNFSNMSNELNLKLFESQQLYLTDMIDDELLELYNKYQGISVERIGIDTTFSIPTFYKHYRSIDDFYKKYKLKHDIRYKSEHRTIQFVSSLLNEEPILQFTDTNIRNPATKRKFRMDAYFKNHNLVLEYNGRQHYMLQPLIHKNYSNFLYQLEKDKNKYELLNKYNYKLLIVKYNDTEKTIKENLYLLLDNYN